MQLLRGHRYDDNYKIIIFTCRKTCKYMYMYMLYTDFKSFHKYNVRRIHLTQYPHSYTHTISSFLYLHNILIPILIQYPHSYTHTISSFLYSHNILIPILTQYPHSYTYTVHIKYSNILFYL